MKKYIWISLLFLIGCGTRKVNLSKTSEQQKTEVIEETKSEGSTKSETTSETTYNISDDFFNFGIKPIGDLPAKFVFIHNGQKIEGETSGELNFGTQKRTERGKISTKQLIETTYKTVTKYVTETTYKTSTKNRESESKRSDFAWYVLLAVLFFGLGFYVNSQIPSIIKRFKNK